MTIRCSRYFLDCTSRQSNKFLTVWNTRVDTERMNLTLERLPGRWGSIEVMDTTNRMHLSWVICRVSCNFSEIFIYSLKILYICILIISISLSPNFPQEPISTSCFPPFYFCFNLLSDQSIKECDSLFPQLPTTENSSASSEAFEALLLGLAFVTGLMLPVQFHQVPDKAFVPCPSTTKTSRMFKGDFPCYFQGSGMGGAVDRRKEGGILQVQVEWGIFSSENSRGLTGRDTNVVKVRG